ncbi:MAG: hypothetical protein AAF411_20525 [Myxococcota bacterium]
MEHPEPAAGREEARRRPTLLGVVVVVAGIVLSVGYPLLIWWSLTRYSARTTSLIALSAIVPLALLRAYRMGRAHVLTVLRVPAAIGAALAIGALTDDPRAILATPVLISAALLLSFGWTLREEMSMIERFARMQEPELSPPKVAHCRQMTVLWCVFFVINGAIAGALAVAAPLQWWAAYTSGIAYALMGMLFAFEYALRKYRFRDYGKNPLDALLKRVFPAEGEG